MAKSDTDRQSHVPKDESELETEQQIGAEFAKAFQELARGEQTAAALESRLDGIESRIEQLLASVEENARESAQTSDHTNGTNDTDGTKQSKSK